MSSKERPVVVCTAHRGVFFGYTTDAPEAPTITLRRVRMAVYWCKEVRGVLGLAVSGPLPGCRISPAVPQGVARDVTLVLDCTEEAARAWEEGPWQ